MAQSKQDTITRHYGSLAKARQAKQDNVNNKTNYKIDSVLAAVNITFY